MNKKLKNTNLILICAFSKKGFIFLKCTDCTDFFCADCTDSFPKNVQIVRICSRNCLTYLPRFLLSGKYEADIPAEGPIQSNEEDPTLYTAILTINQVAPEVSTVLGGARGFLIIKKFFSKISKV